MAGAAGAGRLERLGAACVNLAPLLAPGCSFAGMVLGGAAGADALALAFVLSIWSGLGCAAMLVTNAVLLATRRRTLGLMYFQLEVDAPAPHGYWQRKQPPCSYR